MILIIGENKQTNKQTKNRRLFIDLMVSHLYEGYVDYRSHTPLTIELFGDMEIADEYP